MTSNLIVKVEEFHVIVTLAFTLGVETHRQTRE